MDYCLVSLHLHCPPPKHALRIPTEIILQWQKWWIATGRNGTSTYSLQACGQNLIPIRIQHALLEHCTAGYGWECIFFIWASFLAVCSDFSRVRDSVMCYQKALLKNMVWYCIWYLPLFFPPLACSVTSNTGPRLMADPNAKPLVCLATRKNSMKLIIGCVIPLQVQVHVCPGFRIVRLVKSWRRDRAGQSWWWRWLDPTNLGGPVRFELVPDQSL